MFRQESYQRTGLRGATSQSLPIAVPCVRLGDKRLRCTQTAATRSSRFTCHRQRSSHSPLRNPRRPTDSAEKKEPFCSAVFRDSKGGSAGNLSFPPVFRATSPFSRLGVRDHTGGPGGSLHTFSPERKYDRLHWKSCFAKRVCYATHPFVLILLKSNNNIRAGRHGANSHLHWGRYRQTGQQPSGHAFP